MSVVSAGHLPPLIVAVTVDRGRPASAPACWASSARSARSRNCPLAAATIVLLYTDGLVERRDEDIDEGLDRLANSARVLRTVRLADGLSQLVGRIGADRPGSDDVTALAVRRSWPTVTTR